MIFESISLTNFGAYRGTQTASLTPKAGRPVILFGGMNGGGKTTFLDAIQLVLYGSKARTSNRGTTAYKNYLKQCIHRAPDSPRNAAISIDFSRVVDGKRVVYCITRSWKEMGGNIKESLTVILSLIHISEPTRPY